MKEACKQFATGGLKPAVQRALPSAFSVPPTVQRVAQTFVFLQEKRHLADYDLSQRFSRAEVIAFHTRVQVAIADFKQLSDGPARRLFLVSLLTWKTLGSR